MARKPTLTLAQELAALRAKIAALESASPAASESLPKHIGRKGKPDGRSFPCTVAGEVCSKFTYSAARSAVHGIDAGGHAKA